MKTPVRVVHDTSVLISALVRPRYQVFAMSTTDRFSSWPSPERPTLSLRATTIF